PSFGVRYPVRQSAVSALRNSPACYVIVVIGTAGRFLHYRSLKCINFKQTLSRNQLCGQPRHRHIQSYIMRDTCDMPTSLCSTLRLTLSFCEYSCEESQSATA